jgi:hypothetical protein
MSDTKRVFARGGPDTPTRAGKRNAVEQRLFHLLNRMPGRSIKRPFLGTLLTVPSKRASD